MLSGGDLAALAEDRAVLPPDDPLLVISYGSPITNENVFSALDRKFNDMDLRVTARQIAGPDDNQFGVVFRYKDLDNYYAFLISSDGYYSLVKRQGGAPEVISDWGATAVVRQGQVTNEIRIVALGDAFRFFINGEAMPLCLKGENALSMWDPSQPGQCYTGDLTYIYRDTDFAQGRIALTAGSSVDLSGDIVVGFDDLIIIGPDPDIITADVEAE